MSPTANRRECRLLAWSPIADDPRVRRMGDALTEKGWNVIGIGLPGALSSPPAWPILTPPPAELVHETKRSGEMLAMAERAGARTASALLAPAEGLLRIARSPYASIISDVRQRAIRVDRPIAGLVRAVNRRAARRRQEQGLSERDRLRSRFWALSPHLRAMKEIAEAQSGPALWVANDWWMLPIAEAGLRQAGGLMAYDSHELATEEYAERPDWERFQRPIVSAVESSLIREAKVVTTVSPRITEHLRLLYKLDAATMTLRNAPRYFETAFRPSGEKIRMLYHGLVRSGRGLEAMIESVPLLRPEFALTIRGPSDPGYLKQLQDRARTLDVAHRIAFEPPVPMTELVRMAAAFDIGVMALPDRSLHMRYALPNKLFEYLMAGLAILVTDLPEMAGLARSSRSGVIAKDATAASIAAALNATTRDQIDAMKRSALDAAKRYNWENESAPVLTAYAAAMDGMEG
jgi:glycosyltransferase involved in cell wall biosynthesis